MRASLGGVAAVGLALTAGAWLVFDLSTAFGVGVGAGIATVNLWALARIIGALMPTGRGGARAQSLAGWSLLLVLKLLGLIGAVWLLMRHGVVSPLPLVVGYGSLPFGIAIGALVGDRSAPDEEDESVPRR
jgi:hypothetical protein